MKQRLILNENLELPIESVVLSQKFEDCSFILRTDLSTIHPTMSGNVNIKSVQLLELEADKHGVDVNTITSAINRGDSYFTGVLEERIAGETFLDSKGNTVVDGNGQPLIAGSKSTRFKVGEKFGVINEQYLQLGDKALDYIDEVKKAVSINILTERAKKNETNRVPKTRRNRLILQEIAPDEAFVSTSEASSEITRKPSETQEEFEARKLAASIAG